GGATGRAGGAGPGAAGPAGVLPRGAGALLPGGQDASGSGPPAGLPADDAAQPRGPRPQPAAPTTRGSWPDPLRRRPGGPAVGEHGAGRGAARAGEGRPENGRSPRGGAGG